MSMKNEARMSVRQRRAPLFEALNRHALAHPYAYHVPGHRGSERFDPQGAIYFGPLLPLDVTELPGLDNLHDPQGVIAEAQALAAEAFGAEQTHFLVGGSTAGNLAMIWSVCRRGEKILIPRNAHQSVFHACLMLGLRAVIMAPQTDSRLGTAGCVRETTIEEALARHPDARAVLLTNPTYYGLGIDLNEVAGMVHRSGLPLLVDEAHGAHFVFHHDLPTSALACGADAVVQSTHKTLPALTMGAMLHLQGSRIRRDRVAQMLKMIQTSSPSYPVMASLDLARRWMVSEGHGHLGGLIRELNGLRRRLREKDGFWRVPAERSDAYDWTDPLRLVLIPKRGSGFAWFHHMEEEGLYAEFADPLQVVCVFTAASSKGDVRRLARFLQKTDSDFQKEGPPVLAMDASLRRTNSPLRQAGIPTGEGAASASYKGGQQALAWELAACTGEAASCRIAAQWQRLIKETDGDCIEMDGLMHEAREWVPYAEALGRRAAEMLTPYPPGIPLLVMGEEVTAAHLALLQTYLEQGASLQGLKEGGLVAVFARKT